MRKKKDSPEDQGDKDPRLRKGFCQRDRDSAWLFTLNGQRFPTITVEDGKNLLLRLGNLSPNVAYWLELENESTGTKLPLTILSLDGVVPARPVDSEGAKIPVDAISTNDLLLMPASRAEIYIRNDLETGHSSEQVYILRTKLDFADLCPVAADAGPEVCRFRDDAHRLFDGGLPSLPFEGYSGARRIYQCPGTTGMAWKFQPPSAKDSWKRSATRYKIRKVELRGSTRDLTNGLKSNLRGLY